MNVLGLVGSPRKRGNCELLVKEIARHLPDEQELSLLRLADFDLRPCRGCYRCLFEPMTCQTNDDLPVVLEALAAADALIVAVPTYFLGPNALIKVLVDRGLAFYGQAERLWGKPAVGAAVAGIPGKEGYALLGVENFLHILLAEVKMTAVIYGALPGEALLNADNRAMAQRMAEALLAPKASLREEPCCPVCGGRTVRFLGRDRIRCMLCSHEGRLRSGSDGFELDIQPGGMEIFTDQDSARRHYAWLTGMVSQYRERREELKAVQRDLQGIGRLVKKKG